MFFLSDDSKIRSFQVRGRKFRHELDDSQVERVWLNRNTSRDYMETEGILISRNWIRYLRNNWDINTIYTQSKINKNHRCLYNGRSDKL